MYQSLLFFIFLLLTQLSFAQKTISLAPEYNYKNITAFCEYYLDPTKAATVEEVSTPDFQFNFKKVKKTSIDLGVTEKVLWLKFKLKNEDLNINDWLLEIGKNNLPLVTLYYYDRYEKKWYQQQLGTTIPFTQKKIPIRAIIFPLSVNSSDPQTFYLRIVPKGVGLHTQPTVYRMGYFQELNGTEELYYGFLFGIILFMVLNNLFVALATHKVSYFLYVIFNLSLVGIIMHISGHLQEYIFYKVTSADTYFFTYRFLASLTLASGTAFSLYFLELQRRSSTLYRINLLLLITICIDLLIGLLLAPAASMKLLTLTSVLSSLVAISSALYLWLDRVAVARFIFIGSCAFLLGYSVYVLKIAGFLPNYFATKHGLELGAIGGTLFLSMALADKQRLNLIERRKTREEKLKLQQQYNEELEKKVAQRTDELSNLNTELQHTLLTVQDQKEQLAEKTFALKQSNQSKDKLISIIAHDFKSPLNSLKGAVGLLKMNALSKEEIEELAGKLENQITDTLDFVNNLLYWAKSQMQGIEMKPKEIILSDLVKDLIPLHSPMIANKGLSLNNQITEDVKVWADRDSVSLTIRNLLSNAIKFTSKEGTITLSTKPKGDFWEIAVADTGVGMDTATVQDLFETADSTLGTSSEKGTGLGLLLCKDFVEKNGGKIWVESQVGVGSTFFFTLKKIET